jgi:hypothetical protein
MQCVYNVHKVQYIMFMYELVVPKFKTNTCATLQNTFGR